MQQNNVYNVKMTKNSYLLTYGIILSGC